MAKNVGAIRVAFIADTAGFAAGMREMDKSFKNYDQMMRQVEQQQAMLNRSSLGMVSGLTGLASAFGLNGGIVSRTLGSLTSVIDGCSSMQEIYTKAQQDAIEAEKRLVEAKKLNAIAEQQKSVESMAGVAAAQTYTDAQIASAKALMEKCDAEKATIAAESQAAIERATIARQELTTQEESLAAFKSAQKEYRAEYRQRLEVLREGLEEAKILYKDEVSNFEAGIVVEKQLYAEKMASFREQIEAQKVVVENAQKAADEQIAAAAKVRDAEMEKAKAAQEAALAYENKKANPTLPTNPLGGLEKLGVPSWLTGMTQQLSEAERCVGKFSTSLGGVGRSGKAAEAVLKSAWSGIANGIGTAANAVVGFGTALVSTPVGWLTVGVAGLAAGVAYLASESDKASQKTQEQMRLEQEWFDKLIQKTEHLKAVQAGLKTPGMIAQEGFDNIVKSRDEQIALLEEEKRIKNELDKTDINFRNYRKVEDLYQTSYDKSNRELMKSADLEIQLSKLEEELSKYPHDLRDPDTFNKGYTNEVMGHLSNAGVTIQYTDEERRAKRLETINAEIEKAKNENMYFGDLQTTLDRALYEQSDAYIAAQKAATDAAKAKADAESKAARDVEEQKAKEKRTHEEMIKSIEQRTEAYKTAAMKTASEAEKYAESNAKYDQWIKDQKDNGIEVDPKIAGAAKESIEHDYRYSGETGKYLKKNEEDVTNPPSLAKMKSDFEAEAAEKIQAGVWTQADANMAAEGFAEEVMSKLGLDTKNGETETKKTTYLDTDNFASANAFGSVASWKAGLDGMYRETTIVSTMRENNNQNREMIRLAREIAGNVSQKAKKPEVVG